MSSRFIRHPGAGELRGPGGLLRRRGSTVALTALLWPALLAPAAQAGTIAEPDPEPRRPPALLAENPGAGRPDAGGPDHGAAPSAQTLAPVPASAPTGEPSATPAATPGDAAGPSGPARPAGASPAAPSAPSTPDWPTLAGLLGLPDWLTLTLTVNAAPIANPLGGLTSAANWMQQNELNLAAGTGLGRDPATWRGELDHWQARLRLDNYLGQPTFASEVGSLFAPQTMAYPQASYLSGASLQRSSRDGALRISAGYQSLDQDFLVAPPTTSYLFSGFNDTLNLTLPALPITPYAAPSVVLHWRSPGFGTWSAGAYWLDQETELAGLLGAPPALSQDLRGNLQVLQWDLPLWAANPTLNGPIQRQGRITVPRQLPPPLLQLGALRTSASFVSLADSPTGRNPLVNHVAYGSLTLPARLPLGLDNRFWGTLQWGLNPAGNSTPLFLAGGWQCQGLFPERPLDVLSLGIGRTAFSPLLAPGLSWAGAVELNYSFHLNERLSLQPVLQWLPRPTGDGSVPAILTTALQVNLSF
jgi:porin